MLERFGRLYRRLADQRPYTKDVTAARAVHDTERSRRTARGRRSSGVRCRWERLPTQPRLIEPEKIEEFKGDNRVCVLANEDRVAQEQKARLELGSDDGVKVWINGQLVHGANNAADPLRWARTRST